MLNLQLVRTPWGFDLNRRIRNECRTYLTNDQSHIDLLSEMRFWAKNFRRNDLTLYIGRTESNKAVAYGLIRKDDEGQAWLSGGIREKYRGQGYGRLLFAALCSLCSEEAALEVFANNLPALNLYYSLGFREVGRVVRNWSVIIVMTRTLRIS